MAFLGSLGKALGLDSEFGKGLITGTASSLDREFQDDIKRTKDNIDNLVNISYQGAVEEKKRYDKQLKENKDIVDQIIANVGGDKGASHPRAVDAAQTLIKQYGGLKGALTYSESLSNMSRFSGEHPISILELGERTNNNNPLTAMALAKSTVDPVVLPDAGALGKDAAVGIMKLDFFGGGDFAEKEISTRAGALLKARGVNINETQMDLPPALKANIDPLIFGMRSNVTEEKARLHIMHNKLDKKDPEYNTKSARILDMIENINNIEKDMKSPIEGLSDSSIKSNFNFLEREITQQYFGTDGLKTNDLGKYIGPNVKIEQLKVLKRHASYYVNKLNQAARMQKVTSAEAGSILTKIREAVEKGKQVIIGEDGKVYIGTKSIFDLPGYEGDKAILGVKEDKPDMPGKDGDKDKDKNDDNSLLKLGEDISEEAIAKGVAIIRDQRLFKRNRKAFVQSKIGMEYLKELTGLLYLQRTKNNNKYTLQDARTEALLLLGIRD
tara:strand:- start:8902 stop:10395 length:1494 start_codon:yes stop_codon:yes gene_type:complete